MTLSQLIYIMRASELRCKTYLPLFEVSMAEFKIVSLLQRRAFLASVGHESGGLKWTTEIWGPTAEQVRYEGRQDLGNTHAGDGYRYRGRGLIQITGFNNYIEVSNELGKNFMLDPDMLAQPSDAVRSACWWFAHNGCNELAEQDGFLSVSRRINCGSAHTARIPNGWDDRQAYYTRTAVLERADFSNVVAGGESTA